MPQPRTRSRQEFAEFRSVESFLRALPSHRALKQTYPPSALVALPMKLALAAAHSYVAENPGAESSMKISELMVRDLRKYGFRVDIERLNRGVLAEFRKFHPESGFGGYRGVRPSRRRRETAGFKDRVPRTLVSKEEFLRFRQRFSRMREMKNKARKSVELPNWRDNLRRRP